MITPLIKKSLVRKSPVVNGLLVKGGSSGGTIETVYGTNSITLLNAKANGLKALTLFGGTEQSGTPTPTTPQNIVSNNGVLKFGVLSTNLLDLANCTDGYYYTPAGEYAATPNARLSNYIPVKAGVTYTVGLTGTEGQSNVRINLFDTAKNWLSQTVFVSYAGEKRTQSITPTQDGFLAFSANYLSSSRVDWNTAQVVQGSYTAETMPEYEPYRTGIYTDGTVETVQDSLNNTATAEMLLKVGNYQDVQSVLDGKVTRNVGIKVLDGTENWTASGNLFYAGIATDALEDTHSCYCTHFKGVATNASANYDNEIKVGTNATQTVNWTRVQIYPVVGTYSNVTAFKQFLADQYANGTPVIVVYPLATSTTETVTGQHLTTKEGTNTISITQASISSLDLEAKYKKGK